MLNNRALVNTNFYYSHKNVTVMKTKTTLLAAIFALIALNSQATTWTVSNNPNSPGQFTSLQAAINNADFYDTIMVAGSATSYGNITINKPLCWLEQGIIILMA
jgi:hypothetical protein